MRDTLTAVLAAFQVGIAGALTSGAVYYWRLIRRRELRRRLDESNLRALVRLFAAEDRLVQSGVQHYRAAAPGDAGLSRSREFPDGGSQ